MPYEEIEEVKKRFVEMLKPKEIYLFGSFAKGTQNENSDLDFYIVMPDGTENKTDLLQKAYRSLRGLKRRSVDIVLEDVSTFRKRRVENTLERIVTKEGILVYGE